MASHSRSLVDCPSCTFVDRKEKRQLRGHRYYIHGLWSLPTSGSMGRDHLSPLSRPMSAPLSSCNGSTYPFCCSLARMTETISSHRMQASLHNARQVAPGGPKEPSHEFSTSQNAHARSRRKPEGRSPLFENASSYCWRLLATNRWLLLRGLSGSVRTSSPASARGFRYACAT